MNPIQMDMHVYALSFIKFGPKTEVKKIIQESNTPLFGYVLHEVVENTKSKKYAVVIGHNCAFNLLNHYLKLRFPERNDVCNLYDEEFGLGEEEALPWINNLEKFIQEKLSSGCNIQNELGALLCENFRDFGDRYQNYFDVESELSQRTNDITFNDKGESQMSFGQINFKGIVDFFIKS